MKKIVSLILCIVLCVTLCIPALASEAKRFDIYGLKSYNTQNNYMTITSIDIKKSSDKFIYGYEHDNVPVYTSTAPVTVLLNRGYTESDKDVDYDIISRFWADSMVKSGDTFHVNQRNVVIADGNVHVSDYRNKESDIICNYHDYCDSDTIYGEADFMKGDTLSLTGPGIYLVYTADKSLETVSAVLIEITGSDGNANSSLEIPKGINGYSMPFTDVADSAWYASGVNYVYNLKIMGGKTATEFSPNSYINRGQLIVAVWRLAGEPEPIRDAPFTDVPPSYDFKCAIGWAYDEHIVNGVTATTFGSNKPVTRQQLAAILYSYAKYRGMYSGEDIDSLDSYSDSDNVAGYASAALSWITSVGVMSGSNGRINPTGLTTRAQTAVILSRFSILKDIIVG